MNDYIEKIELQVVAPKTGLPGVDNANQRLLALQGTIDRINHTLAGLSTHSAFQRTAATIGDTIKQLQAKVGKGVTMKDISQVLGYDPKDVREYFVREQERLSNAMVESERKRARLRGAEHAKARAKLLEDEKQTQRELDALRKTFEGRTLKSSGAGSAARFFHGYQQAAVKQAKDPIAMIQAIVGKGGVPSMAAGPATAGVGGPVNLVIPPSQIFATLGPGMVNVVIPPGQMAGAVGGGGKGAAASGGAAAPAPGGGVVTQVRTEQPSGKTRTRSVSGSTTTDTFTGGKAVVTEDLKAKARESLLTSLEKIRADYVKGVGDWLKKPVKTRQLSDLTTLGQQASQQSAALAGQAQFAPLGKRTVQGLTQKFGKSITKDAERLADDVQGQMTESFQRVADLRKTLQAAKDKGEKAEAARLRKAIRAEEQSLASLNTFYATGDRATKAIETVRQKTAAFDDKDRRKQVLSDQQKLFKEATYQGAQQAAQEFMARGGRLTSQTQPYRGNPGKLVMEKDEGEFRKTLTVSFGKAGAEATMVTRALKATRDELGLLGGDFIKNTAKVAIWSASVGVLYQTMNLARTSFANLLNVGAQAAKLDQVFTGIGGSTKQLTNDVLRLAAVYGRAGDETMEATIKWARVLKTKAQINEAVRVSLMGANVAELTVAESTDQLMAIMQAYGLQVGSLRTVLAELNAISNTYNVTNAEMLEGISKTASLAKQAGLPLQELMGLVGSTVGATAQTGANIGTAIKSVITALGNPLLQEKLRQGFSLEVTGGGDDLKGMSQILSDVFVRYQKLNEAQRQSLLFQVAGKTQSSRLAAILDNYVKAQALAINAQLNLNSAQEENAKIVGALKSQLMGVATEWERFIVIQGNRGPVTALSEISKGLRNVLSLMNTPVGSAMTTGFMGLLAAAAAKVALTGFTLKQGVSQGFMGRSFDRVLGAGHALNQATNRAATQFAAKRNLTARNASILPLWGPDLGIMERIVTSTNVWGEAMLRTSRSANISNGAVRALFATMGVGFKAISLATMALSQFLIPLAVVTGGIWVFNKAMEAIGLSSEAAEAKLAGFNAQAERAAAAANSFTQASELMKTVQNAFNPERGFQGMRPEDAKRLIEQSSTTVGMYEPDLDKRRKLQEQFKKEAEALRQQGNLQGIIILAEAERNRLISARREELQKEFEAIESTEKELADEIKRLRATDETGRFRSIGRDSRLKLIAEKERQQSETNDKKARNVTEQTNALAEQTANTQRHRVELEKQRLTLESIAEIFNSVSTNNPLEKAMVRLAMLDAQRAANDSRARRLRQQDDSNLAGIAERESKVTEYNAQEKTLRTQLMEARRKVEMFGRTANMPDGWQGKVAFQDADDARVSIPDLESQLKLLDKKREMAKAGRLPGLEPTFAQSQEQQKALREENERIARERAAVEANRNLIMAQTRVQFGQRDARLAIAPSNYGRDQVDRLLRQHEALNRQIEALEAKPNKTLQDRGRLMETLMMLGQNWNDMRMRAADIEAEIHQRVMDTNKEFARSLFGAGPAEMLRKLAAFRLAFDDKGRKRPDLSMGAFFGLSPEARTNYGQLNPNYNAEYLELKRERERARNTIGAMQPERVDDQMLALSAKLGKWADDLAKHLPLDAFNAAKETMDHFSGSVSQAGVALDAFAAQVMAKAQAMSFPNVPLASPAPAPVGKGGALGY